MKIDSSSRSEKTGDYFPDLGIGSISPSTTTKSQTNHYLPRQSSLHSSLSTLLADLQHQQQQQPPLQPNQFMNMDDLFKNIYSSPQIEAESDAHAQFVGASVPREDVVANKSLDHVWKGIAVGASEKITLEEFLMNKTGADVDLGNQAGVYAPVDPAVINGGQFSGFVNNGGGERPRLVGPGGRGKRRVVEEPPVDKAKKMKGEREKKMKKR